MRKREREESKAERTTYSCLYPLRYANRRERERANQSSVSLNLKQSREEFKKNATRVCRIDDRIAKVGLIESRQALRRRKQETSLRWQTLLQRE